MTPTDGRNWIADVTPTSSTETHGVYNLVVISREMEQPPAGTQYIQVRGVIAGKPQSIPEEVLESGSYANLVVGLYADTGATDFAIRFPAREEIFRGPGDEKPSSLEDLRTFLGRPAATTEKLER